RSANPTERLSVPTLAIPVCSDSMRCFIINQLNVYMSAKFKKRSSKNTASSAQSTLRYIPSNFRTAKPTERLSVPAVAIAVFSETVRCFIVDQLKVYISAKFENRRSKNSTPSRRIYATYLPITERRDRQRVRLSTPSTY